MGDWIDDDDNRDVVTPEMITEAISRIVPADNELAHSAEDAIHRAVLRAISQKRAEDVSLCAFAALKTWDLGFTRWYA
jgi:hypothetical protein